MIEIEDYDLAVESAIDDLVFEINLTYDCFISMIIFSKKGICSKAQRLFGKEISLTERMGQATR